MKRRCPVCMEKPVVYSVATTCSMHCWAISIQGARPVIQTTMFEESVMAKTPAATSEKREKPRVTMKAKRIAYADIMDQINKNNWDPKPETWKIIDSLAIEIAEADEKGAKDS